MINSDDLKLYLSSIGAIEENSLFAEITAEQSSIISGGNVLTTTRPGGPQSTTLPALGSSGGTTLNFDINAYMFALGAGAIFNGGVTNNVVDIAFQRGIFTRNQ